MLQECLTPMVGSVLVQRVDAPTPEQSSALFNHLIGLYARRRVQCSADCSGRGLSQVPR